MSHLPHPEGRIVELARFPSRLEADVVLARLADEGIRAIADYGDGGGWLPHFAYLQGARVLVFDDDLPRAQRLLAAPDPLDDGQR